MRPRTLVAPRADLRLAWGVAALAGSGALWLQAMAPQLTAALRLGQICTGHAAFAPHCPACYVAAAVAAGAAGLLATGIGRDVR
jgi:hypothetical protein